VKAGESLERAQREAIMGGDSNEFIAGRREEARLVRRLVEASSKLLESAGHSAADATLDRISKTLRAAAVTPTGREALKAGHLTEELEAPGFEVFSDLARGSSKRSSKAGRPERGQGDQVRRRIHSLRRQAEQAHTAARQQSEEADVIERRARDAERETKKIRRLADTARKRSDRTIQRARHLDDKLRELEETNGEQH
jgi:Asp-tRNA(Asn)/Glu-tRNA(Gln) amidotransferase A subunit family amidase